MILALSAAKLSYLQKQESVIMKDLIVSLAKSTKK